jgi:hypothetical protein
MGTVTGLIDWEGWWGSAQQAPFGEGLIGRPGSAAGTLLFRFQVIGQLLACWALFILDRLDRRFDRSGRYLHGAVAAIDSC